MQEIYRVEGTLNRGFVGQITYTVCLERPYHKMDIEFVFDQQRYGPEDVTPEAIEAMRRLFREKYQIEMDEETVVRRMLGEMKTEIHTLAMLNDTFIGCIHKQLTERHMHYDGEDVSEGCLPQEVFEGVLKVTVLVFNVLKDQTHYRLCVRGE